MYLGGISGLLDRLIDLHSIDKDWWSISATVPQRRWVHLHRYISVLSFFVSSLNNSALHEPSLDMMIARLSSGQMPLLDRLALAPRSLPQELKWTLTCKSFSWYDLSIVTLLNTSVPNKAHMSAVEDDQH